MGRYIELTDAGQALLPLARELVTRSVHIEETMKSLEGEVYGHLLVGCSTTPGKYVLPSLLANFHRRYPKVRVSCHVASQDHALQMVCDGEVHFALASVPHMVCKDVEFRQFMTDEVILLAPLGHPWADRGEIEPEELLEAEFLGQGAEVFEQRFIRLCEWTQGFQYLGLIQFLDSNFKHITNNK